MSFRTGASGQIVVEQGEQELVVTQTQRSRDRKAFGTTAGNYATPDSQRASATMPSSIIANWGEVTHSDISNDLFDRLVRLAMARDGWRGPGSLAMSGKSLREFLSFWKSISHDAVEPELSLGPDGSLSAEWFKDFKQRLDVRFLSNKVVFGLIANNTILEGAERPDLVALLLSQHPTRPLTWSPKK